MKLFFSILFAASFVSGSLQAISNCFICYSQANGDSITLWDDYGSSGFQIYAAVQVGGVTTPGVPISDPSLSQQKPKGCINADGNAVVVWRANDDVTNNPTLYGVTYDKNTDTWSSQDPISDAVNEQVLEDFCVKLADNDNVVITWHAYLPGPSTDVMRQSWSDSFGVWGSPTTIP